MVSQLYRTCWLPSTLTGETGVLVPVRTRRSRGARLIVMPHGRGMTGTGIAAERQADAPMYGAQPFCLAGARTSDAGQRFGERFSLASKASTAEAPDANQQDGRAAEAHHITQAAPVGAMNTV